MGWYSTGPRIREADIDINQMMTDYTPNPVLVITEVEVSTPREQRARPYPWSSIDHAMQRGHAHTVICSMVHSSRAAWIRSAQHLPPCHAVHLPRHTKAGSAPAAEPAAAEQTAGVRSQPPDSFDAVPSHAVCNHLHQDVIRTSSGLHPSV